MMAQVNCARSESTSILWSRCPPPWFNFIMMMIVCLPWLGHQAGEIVVALAAKQLAGPLLSFTCALIKNL